MLFPPADDFDCIFPTGYKSIFLLALRNSGRVCSWPSFDNLKNIILYYSTYMLIITILDILEDFRSHSNYMVRPHPPDALRYGFQINPKYCRIIVHLFNIGSLATLFGNAVRNNTLGLFEFMCVEFIVLGCKIVSACVERRNSLQWKNYKDVIHLGMCCVNFASVYCISYQLASKCFKSKV